MSWSRVIDSKTSGCLSPMDLLMRWLLAPGNYKRWTSQAKTPLKDEIVNMMKDHGIQDRSPGRVYDKIYSLERSYKSARAYLVQHGQLKRFLEYKASKIVEKTVLRKCFYFRELSEVFENSEEVDGAKDETSGGHNGGSSSSTTNTVETESIPLQRAQGKRKLPRGPRAMSDEGPKKRERQEDSHPSSSLAIRAPEVAQGHGGIALCFQDGNYLASPLAMADEYDDDLRTG